MSETTLTPERVTELLELWRKEKARYTRMADDTRRREVERGDYRVMARDAAEFVALATAAQQLAAARREVETVTQRAIRAEADLATSRAALEDVLWQEAHPNVEVVSRRRAEDDEKLWVAYDRSGNVNDTEWFAIAEGDTWKEALRNARRALAQEAGDG